MARQCSQAASGLVSELQPEQVIAGSLWPELTRENLPGMRVNVPRSLRLLATAQMHSGKLLQLWVAVVMVSWYRHALLIALLECQRRCCGIATSVVVAG